MKFIINKYGRGSVFFTFLLSYIVVLLVPLSIGSISYIKAAQTVKEEAERYNRAILRQVSQAVDSQMQAVDRMVEQIGFNSAIRSFLRIKRPLTSADRYAITQISKDLYNYKVPDSIVEQLYIYFKNSDMFVSPSARYDSPLVYDRIFHYSGMEYNEWLEAIRGYHLPAIEPKEIVDSNNELRKMIVYIYPLPLGEKVYISGVVIALIDENRFKELFADIPLIDDGSVYIINNEGEIIASAGVDRITILNEYRDQILNGKKDYINTNNGQMIVNIVPSEYNGWQYISLIPREIFMAKVRYIKNITLFTELLCIISGLIIAFLLAHRNYIPIKGIMEELKGKDGNIVLDYKNEYMFIKNALSSLIPEQKVMELVNERTSALEDDFWVKLINGEIQNHYYCPIESETKLIKAVKTCDLNAIEKELSFLFEENLLKRSLSLDGIRCFLFNIIDAAIKATRELNVDIEAIFGTTLNFSGCKNIEETKQNVLDFYYTICRYIDKHRKSHNYMLRIRLIDYIDQHYTDSNLSLKVLADQFAVSPSYISRFFKEQVGENLVDYINKKKISLVKQLLNDKNLNLESIAQKVGYTSDVVLLHTFKKYEGITPGKYREQFCNNDKGFQELSINVDKVDQS